MELMDYLLRLQELELAGEDTEELRQKHGKRLASYQEVHDVFAPLVDTMALFNDQQRAITDAKLLMTVHTLRANNVLDSRTCEELLNEYNEIDKQVEED